MSTYFLNFFCFFIHTKYDMKKKIKKSEEFKSSETQKSNRKLALSKFYFAFFIFAGLSFLIHYIYTTSDNANEDELSGVLMNSYNTSRLYLNSQSEQIIETDEELVHDVVTDNNDQDFSIIGVLKIDALSLEYPILSRIDDDLLKISPCRFYGPLPGNVRKSLYSWS